MPTLTPGLDLPPIIGHRGSADLAPENTLAGLRRAHEEGASFVEFDVKLTADRVPVLIHDERLRRTTNGRGKVAHTFFEDIRGLDAGGWFAPAFAGEPVPTLEQALALCIELGLGVNLELKPCPGLAEETARTALATLGEIWPDHLLPPLISSFDQTALATAQDLRPDLPRGLLVTRLSLTRWPAAVARFGARSLNVGNRWIKPKHIETADRLGVPVLVYTVNDPDRALALWDMGVTSIFTDRVDRMVRARDLWASAALARTPTKTRLIRWIAAVRA